MEKGKNRSDLLAAGRKKLHQFRQKKEPKGSSNSGQQGKSKDCKPGKTTVNEVVPLDPAPEVELATAPDSKGASVADAAGIPTEASALAHTSLLASTAEDSTQTIVDAQLVPNDMPLPEPASGTSQVIQKEHTPAEVSSCVYVIKESLDHVGTWQEHNSVKVDQCNRSLVESPGTTLQTESSDNRLLQLDDRNHVFHGITSGDRNSVFGENNPGVYATVEIEDDTPFFLKPEGFQEKNGTSVFVEEINKVEENLFTQHGNSDIEDLGKSDGIPAAYEDSKTIASGLVIAAEVLDGSSSANGSQEKENKLDLKLMNETTSEASLTREDALGQCELEISDTRAFSECSKLRGTDEFHLQADASVKAENDPSMLEKPNVCLTKIPGYEDQSQDVSKENENRIIPGTDESEVDIDKVIVDGSLQMLASNANAHLEIGTVLGFPENQLILSRKNMQRSCLNSSVPQPIESILLKCSSDAQSVGILGFASAEEIEGLKHHLYITYLNNEFLQLQFDEPVPVKTTMDACFSNQASSVQDLSNDVEEIARLREEFAYCKNKLQCVSSDREELEAVSISAGVEIEVLCVKTCELQSKLELCQEESNAMMAELSSHKVSLEALQMENLTLKEHLFSITKEKNDLQGEKGHLAHENVELSSALLKQKEQLVTSLSKQAQLEDNVKESLAFLETLTEENLSLAVSLAVHNFKLKDLNESHHLLNKAGEPWAHGKSQNLISAKSENPQPSQFGRVKGVCELEDYPLHHEHVQSFYQATDENHSDVDAFSALKAHLKEADKFMKQVEMTIKEMHSMSTIRSGNKLSAPGVSKLIQAFESKTSRDDSISNHLSPDEGERMVDSLTFAKQQTMNLRNTMEQMDIYVNTAATMFMAERNSSTYLKELVTEHESQKQQNDGLEVKIVELHQHLSRYKLVIDGLQSQLNDISRNTVDESERFISQVELLQKEVNQSSIEWNVIRDVISVSLENLDVHTGVVFPDCSDLGSHVNASIRAAVTEIEHLSGKLEAVSKDYDMLRISHVDMQKDFIKMQENKKDIQHELIMTHSGLRDLIVKGGLCEEGNAEKEDIDVSTEEFLKVLQESRLTHFKQLNKLLDERLMLLSAKNELEMELLSRNQGVEELKERYIILTKDLEDVHSSKKELKKLLIKGRQETEVLNDKLSALSKMLEDHGTSQLLQTADTILPSTEISAAESVHTPLMLLEASIASLLQKYEEIMEDVCLSKKHVMELFSLSEFQSHCSSVPLHIFLTQTIAPKVMESNELHKKVFHLNLSNAEQENEIKVLRERLMMVEDALQASHSETQSKSSELEQSELRLSSVREKLSMAVAKGKGLIVHRDSLKKSLAEKMNELEKCLQELKSKETMLHEVEAKLKSYSEADRVEALESELSYIRNSASAFRDSFLLKDSILQRIEEILDDLDLPEHFHSRDTIEKIELLARSASGNSSLFLSDWDKKSSIGGSQSDTGFGVIDPWKEDVQQASNTELDDYKKKFEELQSKFYGLAEHNDMLEQSLMERNSLVQRWEEAFDGIDMPSYLRSMEPDVRIEWLGKVLSEAQHERVSLLTNIENLEQRYDSSQADLEESQKKVSELETSLASLKHEIESLQESLDKLRCENSEYLEKEVKDELDKDHLRKDIAFLQEKMAEKLENKEYHNLVGEMENLHDLIHDVLKAKHSIDVISCDNPSEHLKVLLGLLVDDYKTLQHEILEEKKNRNVDQRKIADEQEIKYMQDIGQDLLLLKTQLEEVSCSLVLVEKERDTALEKYHFLLFEMEETSKQRDALLEDRDAAMENYRTLLSQSDLLSKQRDSLLDQLNQEEQRSALTKEKLNVAIRKGKGLVQQRDSLKQTIEEMNAEMSRVQNELNQWKLENALLRNQLAETNSRLKDNGQTLSDLLSALHAVDLGPELHDIDPIHKLETVRKLILDCRAAAVSSDHEAKKSRRAAELLLAELNEVQERADTFQEQLLQAEASLAEASKQRDEMEAARADALSCFIRIKSFVEELRSNCFIISCDLSNALHMELNFFHCLETSAESILRQINDAVASDLDMIDYSSLSFNNTLFQVKSGVNTISSQLNMPKDFDEISVLENLQITEECMSECAKELDDLKEKSHEYSFNFEQKSRVQAVLIGTILRKLATERANSEFLKQDITHHEMVQREMESEVKMMRRNFALLYEACSNSVLEIENKKSQTALTVSGSVDHLQGETEIIKKLPSYTGNIEPAGENANSLEDNYTKTMADTLLSSIKGLISKQEEITDGSHKELKSTISNLQRELEEKDMHCNKICSELASQIKDAEAVAKTYSVDLDLAMNKVLILENQVKLLQNDKKALELKVTELEGLESTLSSLQERITYLTNSMAAKDNEIEGLMQALDEEESQMETFEIKNHELEKLMLEKSLAFESLEASRTKTMTKLSTTINKFDELHHLSENLLAEIENLQSQLQERESEISFLRKEVTRCTDNVLTEQESNKKNSADIDHLQRWLEMMISRFDSNETQLDHDKCSQIQRHTEFLDKKISAVMSEVDDLRIASQSKDALLEIERDKLKGIVQDQELLGSSLFEEGSQLKMLQSRDSGQPSTTSSIEPFELELLRKKGTTLSSAAPLVRSGRKANSDYIAIDLEQHNTVEDEDDDKAHGFKSLTMSRVVPRATRPITDRIDGLWVSVDRLLMRQPSLRLGLMLYWIVLHSLLATFI